MKRIRALAELSSAGRLHMTSPAASHRPEKAAVSPTMLIEPCMFGTTGWLRVRVAMITWPQVICHNIS